MLAQAEKKLGACPATEALKILVKEREEARVARLTPLQQLQAAEQAVADARSAEEVATQKLEQARRYLDAERTHRVQAESELETAQARLRAMADPLPATKATACAYDAYASAHAYAYQRPALQDELRAHWKPLSETYP